MNTHAFKRLFPPKYLISRKIIGGMGGGLINQNNSRFKWVLYFMASLRDL